MPQFYTTTQMDQLAAFLGNEVKTTREGFPTVATSYTSFVSALEAALIGEGANNGGGEVTPEIRCIPTATAWSNPITLSEINYPASNGGLNVILGTYDSSKGSLINIGNWIDLSDKTTIMEFLQEFANTGSFNPKFYVDIEDLGNGSARFRLVPNDNNSEGYTNRTSEKYYAGVGAELFTYNLDYPGTNAEKTVDLSTFFNEDIVFETCTAIDNTSPDLPS